VNQYGIALFGLTAVVAGLFALLVFALVRFSAAVRRSRDDGRGRGANPAVLSAALHDAVVKLKSQEAEMRTRADAFEQLSRDIVNSLTAGLLVVDRTGRIEILNPAGRRMIGCDGEADGADYHTALASVPPLVAVVEECLATGTAVARRAMQVPDRLPPLHLGVTVSPLRGEAAPRGVICLFSDISSVAELEDQLRQKETLARLGELAAGIAHEFRNGLATIHGYSRLIDPHALPGQYRPYVEGIRQESDALGKVVTEFLKFARPERIVMGTVDLDALIRRVADEMRLEVADGTAIEVVDTFPSIAGDEVLLRQALGNLIRNAVEACDAAGVPPRITIRREADENHRACRMAVDDNGPGIPEPARDKIFQPFFTTRKEGTGMGLAIVQKIVVLHDGRIITHQSPAGGARFEITLPLAAGPA